MDPSSSARFRPPPGSPEHAAAPPVLTATNLDKPSMRYQESAANFVTSAGDASLNLPHHGYH